MEQHSKRGSKKFKDYTTGYVHIDISEIYLGKSSYYLFVSVERVNKFAYVELHDNKKGESSCGFITNVIKSFPFKIHRVLSDNESQFTYVLLANHLRPRRGHPFDIICRKHGIKHKLMMYRHPWTNGQVEQFNRTLKEYTTNTYKYDSLEQLRSHLHDFVMAYNFAMKLNIFETWNAL